MTTLERDSRDFLAQIPLPSATPIIEGKTLALMFGMYALFLGNVFLYFWNPQAAWIHVSIGVLAIHMSFTIWHESAHLNVSRYEWLNHFVGVLGIFPYMAPYFSSKWIHLQHHARLNEPDDPNSIYAERPFWKVPLRYIRGARFVKQLLKKNKFTLGQKLSDMCTSLLVVGTYLCAITTGYGFALLILWLLPFLIAKLIMDWYVNYLPHVDLPADKYRGTRIITAAWLTPLVFAHNYHAIHHFWPRHPWHRYPQIYRRSRGYLIDKGVPIESSPFRKARA